MANDAIIEVTDGNFDQTVLKSDQPVMVDFWAAWCSPCKALAPVVDEVAAAYAGKVKVGKMDVDQNPTTPVRYGVRGIPTLLIFKQGKVQEQIVGSVKREIIEKALDKHVSQGATLAGPGGVIGATPANNTTEQPSAHAGNVTAAPQDNTGVPKKKLAL